MQISDSEFAIIGPTIKAVVEAESKRLFSLENNTPERWAFVYTCIRAKVSLALLDSGIAIEKITREIDPSAAIIVQTAKDGYIVPEVRQG